MSHHLLTTIMNNEQKAKLAYLYSATPREINRLLTSRIIFHLQRLKSGYDAESLLKAQKILEEFIVNIEPTHPAADHLMKLYVYFWTELNKYRETKNYTDIEPLLPLLHDLADMWAS